MRINTGGSRCSNHNVYEVVLKNLLLDEIKQHVELIRINENKILSTLMDKLTNIHSEEKTVSAKQRQRLKQELHELELRAQVHYKNKVSRIISSERFTDLK